MADHAFNYRDIEVLDAWTGAARYKGSQSRWTWSRREPGAERWIAKIGDTHIEAFTQRQIKDSIDATLG